MKIIKMPYRWLRRVSVVFFIFLLILLIPIEIIIRLGRFFIELFQQFFIDACEIYQHIKDCWKK